MIFMFKTFLYFNLSFFILNIPINNQKLFYHLEIFSKPYSKIIIKTSKHAFYAGKKIAVKLFTNSSNNFINMNENYSSNAKAPQYNINMKRKKKNLDIKNFYKDSYTREEENLLRDVMLNN